MLKDVVNVLLALVHLLLWLAIDAWTLVLVTRDLTHCAPRRHSDAVYKDIITFLHCCVSYFVSAVKNR